MRPQGRPCARRGSAARVPHSGGLGCPPGQGTPTPPQRPLRGRPQGPPLSPVSRRVCRDVAGRRCPLCHQPSPGKLTEQVRVQRLSHLPPHKPLPPAWRCGPASARPPLAFPAQTDGPRHSPGTCFPTACSPPSSEPAMTVTVMGSELPTARHVSALSSHKAYYPRGKNERFLLFYNTSPWKT